MIFLKSVNFSPGFEVSVLYEKSVGTMRNCRSKQVCVSLIVVKQKNAGSMQRDPEAGKRVTEPTEESSVSSSIHSTSYIQKLWNHLWTGILQSCTHSATDESQTVHTDCNNGSTHSSGCHSTVLLPGRSRFDHTPRGFLKWGLWLWGMWWLWLRPGTAGCSTHSLAARLLLLADCCSPRPTTPWQFVV